MSGDFLTSFLAKLPSDENKDVILNLLLKYILVAENGISEETR